MDGTDLLYRIHISTLCWANDIEQITRSFFSAKTIAFIAATTSLPSHYRTLAWVAAPSALDHTLWVQHVPQRTYNGPDSIPSPPPSSLSRRATGCTLYVNGWSVSCYHVIAFPLRVLSDLTHSIGLLGCQQRMTGPAGPPANWDQWAKRQEGRQQGTIHPYNDGCRHRENERQLPTANAIDVSDGSNVALSQWRATAGRALSPELCWFPRSKGNTILRRKLPNKPFVICSGRMWYARCCCPQLYRRNRYEGTVSSILTSSCRSYANVPLMNSSREKWKIKLFYNLSIATANRSYNYKSIDVSNRTHWEFHGVDEIHRP